MKFHGLLVLFGLAPAYAGTILVAPSFVSGWTHKPTANRWWCRRLRARRA